MPSSAAFTQALKEYADKMANSLQQGEFASLVSDVKGVHIYIIIELAMDSRSCWFLYCGLTFVHVLTKVFGRLHCLDFHSWLYSLIRGIGNYFPLQCGSGILQK